MTRKEAIKIVVANVKMGWVNIDWTHVEIRRRMGAVKILFEVRPESTTKRPAGYWGGWWIPRKGLEKNGHLKGEQS